MLIINVKIIYIFMSRTKVYQNSKQILPKQMVHMLALCYTHCVKKLHNCIVFIQKVQQTVSSFLTYVIVKEIFLAFKHISAYITPLSWSKDTLVLVKGAWSRQVLYNVYNFYHSSLNWKQRLTLTMK